VTAGHGPGHGSGAVVYVAGSRWSGVAGTDRRLATALGLLAPVLWVDPPFSVLTRTRVGARETNRTGRSRVAPGVTCLQTLAPPGASRPGISSVTARLVARGIRSSLLAAGHPAAAVVVASPRERFPTGVPGLRILYVTDDWPAGAALMGLPIERVRSRLERNLRQADVVAAVSPVLAGRLERDYGVPVVILPNGCEPNRAAPALADTASAGLVGQLNERLDVGLLEAVRAGGTPLEVVGPRTDRDAATRRQLDRLLTGEGVTWHGPVPFEELPARLARMGVGLTPYADSEFNRSSFPLKILEYLAAGLPVVSTDLAAVRWLDTDLITVARDPQDFARHVREILARPADPAERARRIAFAAGHSWDARAQQLLALASGQPNTTSARTGNSAQPE